MARHARHRMAADLTRLPDAPPPTPGARPPREGDLHEAELLAQLMLDSYKGTIDDDGDTLEFARSEVTKLLRGDWGAFRADRSEVVERAGRLAAATLVTTVDGAPFLAFSMTAPEWKRHGLARAGLQRVMRTLAAQGETSLWLVVTEGNTPAERLYESLGFRP